MAELITIARPYARAAFESASGAGQLAPWSEFLSRAATLVQDPQLAPLLGNPRMLPQDLVQLLLDVAASSATSAPLREEMRNFLALLAHNQRLALLPPIASQYEALRADAENIADVQVLAARELTAEQAQKLQAALERRLCRKVRLHAGIDASLLGGAVVQYGDYVVDGSLRRRVERLASDLSGA